MIAGGIDTFLPRLRVGGTRRYSGKALFPGYLFAHFVLEERFNDVRFARGVASVVAMGGGPVCVDKIVERLKNQTGPDGLVDLTSGLQNHSFIAMPQVSPQLSLASLLSVRNRIRFLLTAVSCQSK